MATYQPIRGPVQWSAVNDSEEYTAGTGGSDTQPFADGGFVRGIVPMDTGAIIFQEDKIRTMQRTNNQTVFGFSVLHNNIGCFAPNSITAARNTFYWYAQGGFYEGMEAKPIGEEYVNRWIEEKATPEDRMNMRGAMDPVNKIVWWSIKGADETYFLLGYNWVLQEWCHAEVDVAYILNAIPSGYTMDTWDDLGATFDDLPFTFDSPVWGGSGVLLLAGFDVDGDYGFFSGTNLEATLETNDYEGNLGNYMYIGSSRMITDATIDNVTGQIGYRDFPGDPITWATEKSADTNTGRIWHNQRAQTARLRNKIAASSWNTTKGAIVFARDGGSF